MSDAELEKAKREAIEVDRAVRKARRAERNKQAGLGCLAIVGISVVGALLVVGLPPSKKSSKPPGLTPIRSVFIAQPMRKGDVPGGATLDGWSEKRGRDEQVSFHFGRPGAGLVQCQYWSTALKNHLTEQNPSKAACALREITERADGRIEVPFSIVARSLQEGKPRTISGTLILGPEAVRSFNDRYRKP